MDISFGNRKLEQQCSSAGELNKAHGALASIIKLRLDALRAAENLADVDHRPPTRRHKLKGDWKNHFAVDLGKNWRLVFKPLGVDVEKDFELKEVKAVEVVAMIDYH